MAKSTYNIAFQIDNSYHHFEIIESSKDGESMYWDERGKLKKTEWYKNGKLKKQEEY